jgi:hypothetical protein
MLECFQQVEEKHKCVCVCVKRLLVEGEESALQHITTQINMDVQ